MKLRRFQYSTSTDMSGARTNPVLRRDMPMRQPVLRNINNYLRDPKAGQRDMTLEVAAAGRGKYLANALSKGMMELGETLASAEASALATNELMDFKTQLAVAEVNAKGIPLTRTQSYLDPSSGSTKTREIATHKDLVPTFDKAIDGIVDSAAERLPLAVRNQFRAQALNLGAAARDRVVNMAIKKQIEFGKHTIFAAVRKAETQKDVEWIINSPDAQLYFSATELNTVYEEKMKELAIRDYATQIVLAANSGPNARGNLQAIKERVLDGTMQVNVTNARGEVLYGSNDKGELVPLTTAGIDPLHRFLGGDNILKLHNKIEAIGKEMDAVSEKAREEEINGVMNDITATRGDFANASEEVKERYKEFGNNWSDIIQYMVDGGSSSILEASDITTLMARVKAARDGDIAVPQTYGTVLENLELYATRDGRRLIRNMSGLTQTQIQDLEEKSRNMQRAGENWWEKDNPFGNEGFIATKRLKDHFGIVETPDSGVFAKFSTKEKASAVQQAYNTLLRKLHDHVDTIRDGRLKPEKALEWVNEQIDKDIKAGYPLATGGQAKKAGGKAGGTTGTSMDDSPKVTITTPEGTEVGSTTQTQAQSDAEKEFHKTPGSKDENGNVYTASKVAVMPPGPKRDALVKILGEHGHTVVPVVVETKPDEKETPNPYRPGTLWGINIWPPSALPTTPWLDPGWRRLK